MGFSPVKTEVIGALVGVALHSAYTLLFAVCVYTIFYKKTIPRILSFAAFIFYTLSTLFLVFDLRQQVKNFVVQPDSSSAIYTSSWAQSYQIVSFLELFPLYLETINCVALDSILIWRCFAIWNRNLWICVPSILLLLACLAFSVMGLRSSTDDGLPSVWIIAALACSIALNTLTTALIAWRIWRRKRLYERSAWRDPRFVKYYGIVLALVLDTGIIYTITVVIYTVAYVVFYHTIFNIVQRAEMQIMGIVPTLIIVYPSFSKPNIRDESSPEPAQTDNDVIIIGSLSPVHASNPQLEGQELSRRHPLSVPDDLHDDDLLSIFAEPEPLPTTSIPPVNDQ